MATKKSTSQVDPATATAGVVRAETEEEIEADYRRRLAAARSPAPIAVDPVRTKYALDLADRLGAIDGLAVDKPLLERLNAASLLQGGGTVQDALRLLAGKLADIVQNRARHNPANARRLIANAAADLAAFSTYVAASTGK